MRELFVIGKLVVISLLLINYAAAQNDIIDTEMMVKLLSQENEHGTEQYNFK